MYKRGTSRLAVLSLRLNSELICYCFWLISRRKAVTNAALEKWPGNILPVFKNDPAATKSLKPWSPQWKRRAVSNRQALTGKESISISWTFWMKDVVEFARVMTTQRLFSFYLTQYKDIHVHKESTSRAEWQLSCKRIKHFKKQFLFRIEPNTNSCILMFCDIDVHLPSARTPGLYSSICHKHCTRV